MKSYLKFFGLLVVLFNCSYCVSANVVNDLYSAKLPVANQSKQQREQVIKKLFSQVLVKVSGSQQVIANPKVTAALAKAMSYTSGFNFNRFNNRLFMTATFNESLVDQLLKSAGLSIWGKRRPSVMLWLGYEDQQQARNLLNDNSNPQLLHLVQRQAKLRGVPLLLPMWDLEDQMQVDMVDIWGLFSDKVALANKRYHTDFITLAKVYSAGLSYRMSWVIYQMNHGAGEASTILDSGSDEFPTQALALTAVINQSTDFFARQFSVNTKTHSSQVEFNVVNIDSIENYVAVTDYLKSLKAIEFLHLVGVKAGKYRFVADIMGRSKSLLDTIKLDNKLQSAKSYNASDMTEFSWYQSKRRNFALDNPY